MMGEKTKNARREVPVDVGREGGREGSWELSFLHH
jgi:hypothetical protein